MILAIDVGNSNIVFGTVDDSSINILGRIRTETTATSAEYGMKVKDLFGYAGIDIGAIADSAISSVVPAVTESLGEACAKLFGKKPLVVGPGIKTGLNVKIDDPGTLGADFVTGGVGALAEYGCPHIVVDMGTATTFGVVDRNGAFRGGTIHPGVKLSLKALSSGTSLLPSIAITPPPNCVGSNTIDCMRSGIVNGTAAMIDGMIDRIEDELGYPCRVIATGGLAARIIPYCRREIVIDDDLLMKGLRLIYKKNR